MSDLSAKLAAALVLGVVAGGAATILPPSTVHADNCLTEPDRNGTAEGKHWYFHIERGTGRHCWYLRDLGDKAVRTDETEAPAEKAAPERAEAATSRSIANAHAEIGPRTPVPGGASAAATAAPAAAPAAPSVWPSPQAATATANNATTNAPAAAAIPGQSSIDSRWPQAAGSAPAAATQDDASPTVADAAADSSNTAEAAPQAVPPAPTAVPAERNTGSLQKLLLVAFGALALAGLTGSAVYRLGRRRRNDWLRERTSRQSTEKNPDDPPWIATQPAYANEMPDLDEARHALERSNLKLDFEPDESGDHVEKIEDFLARLTQQLQAELKGPRPELSEERGANAS